MAVSRMPKGNTVPIDPDVQIPEAVRRAAAAADAMQKEAYPETVSTPDPHAPPQQLTPREQEERIRLVEADAPKKLPGEVTVTTEKFVPSEQPRPKAENRAENKAQEKTPAPDNDETWREKYEAQLGRVRHLTNQNKELGDRIGTLENLMETMRAPPAAPPPQVAQKLITSQEEEDFGPEMIDVMRRAAKEVATPLLAEIENLRSQVGSTSATLTRTTRQGMLDGLDSAMPDWRDVNVNDEFKAWLALPDPFSGVRRMGLLQQAYDRNETSRVLAFFRSFVSELAATTPVEDTRTRAVTNGAAPQNSRPTLQDLAAPGRARTAASVAPPAEKQIIRTSDINALYAAKRKGLYDGREAEFAGYERELEQATREGRIVRDT
jgi:hypothetical protein